MRALLPAFAMSLIYILDLCAVAVCAITATLEAQRRELDLFGVTVIALIAGIGTSIAMSLQVRWLIAALMGVITGVFGGVIRDILCNEMPLIFRTDIYATAALIGALLLIALDTMGMTHNIALICSMFVIVAIRLVAIRWHIHLPRFRAYE